MMVVIFRFCLPRQATERASKENLTVIGLSFANGLSSSNLPTV